MSLGIRTRLLFVTIIPTLLLVGLFSSSIYREAQRIERDFNQYGTLLAQRTALTARYGALTGNYSSDLSEIDAMMDIPSLMGVTIQDRDGGIALERGSVESHAQIGTESPLDLPCGQSLQRDYFCAPIEQVDIPIDDFLDMPTGEVTRENIGWVRIELTRENIEAQWQQLLINSLLTGLLLILAVFLLLRMVYTQITRPILGISRWVEGIRRGMLTPRNDIASSGEFHALQQGINGMVAEIKHHREDLQSQIDSATAELRSTMDTLEQRNHDLEHERYRAEDANKAKSQFLATMSHEIRTPINAIIGIGQILEQEENTPRQSHLLAQLEGASQLLLGLVNDILDVSKIEAGHLTLEHRPFPIQELLTKVNTLYRSMVADRPIDLITKIDPKLPATLIGDQLRMEQIVVNLLSNALKFTSEGHIAITFHVQDITEERVSLTISVEDTGIGIPEEKQQTLFQPFTQVDHATTRKYGGTGLGLTICQRLISIMGGSIELQSTTGKGSTFSVNVELPYTTDPYISTEPKPCPDVSLRGLHLLVAEDNPINQMVVEELCKSAGIDVTLADDGQEAIDLLGTHPFDAILMDIEMPVLDGYQATKMIRSLPDYTQLPIIAMTAHAMEEARIKAMEVGMDDFVTKPFHLTDLKQRLAERIPRLSAESAAFPPLQALPTTDGLIALPDDINELEIEETLERFNQNRKLYRKLLLEFYRT